jgi:hypothetical protein
MAAIPTHVIAHQDTQVLTARHSMSVRMWYARMEELQLLTATLARAHVHHAIRDLNARLVILFVFF